MLSWSTVNSIVWLDDKCDHSWPVRQSPCKAEQHHLHLRQGLVAPNIHCISKLGFFCWKLTCYGSTTWYNVFLTLDSFLKNLPVPGQPPWPGQADPGHGTCSTLQRHPGGIWYWIKIKKSSNLSIKRCVLSVNENKIQDSGQLGAPPDSPERWWRLKNGNIMTLAMFMTLFV